MAHTQPTGGQGAHKGLAHKGLGGYATCSNVGYATCSTEGKNLHH